MDSTSVPAIDTPVEADTEVAVPTSVMTPPPPPAASSKIAPTVESRRIATPLASPPPDGNGHRLVEDRRILAAAGGVLALVLAGVLVLVLSGGGSKHGLSLSANRVAHTNSTVSPPATSTAAPPTVNTATTQAGAITSTTATVPTSTTATVTPSTTTSGTTSGTVTTEVEGASVTPAAALSSYWHSIGAHQYNDAYNGLAPNAINFSQASFVSQERQAGISSVSFHGHVTSNDGTTATVAVDSLTTHDKQYGCRKWTGSYQMVNQGSQWLIEKANISPQPCG